MNTWWPTTYTLWCFKTTTSPLWVLHHKDVMAPATTMIPKIVVTIKVVITNLEVMLREVAPSNELGHYSCQISWCARFARSQSTRQWTASIGLRRTISQAVRREATLWQPMALTQISTPTEEPQSHHSHRRWWFTGTRDKITSTMLVGKVWQLVMLIIQLYIPQIARCVYVFFPQTHSAEGKEYNPHDERHLSFDRNLISYILITNLFA